MLNCCPSLILILTYLHVGAADNFYCNGSVYIEDSLVKFRWNFQNVMTKMSIFIYLSCTDNGVMGKSESVSNHSVSNHSVSRLDCRTQ